MARIHPTAIVDSGAELADGVEIGAFAVVEADVRIGEGTVLRPHAVVRRYTTLGRGNHVDSFAVLGGEPQDLKFDPRTVSYLRIGDENTFREHVTISRATGEGKATTVGSRTYWMAASHAGHNATIEDEVILANGALIGGHATIQRGAILSGHVLIHQHVWVGERVMTQGGAATGMHVPPFCILARRVNTIASLNVVGLRRAPDITDTDRRQVKRAFELLYRSGLARRETVRQMDEHTDWGPAASRFRDFVRRVLEAEPPYNRGLCALSRENLDREDDDVS